MVEQAHELQPATSPENDESELRNQHGLTVPEVCSSCFGTGMEVMPGKGARRCCCRMQDVRTMLIESARIPRRYEHCQFSNYHPTENNASQLRAYQLAWRLGREYPAVDRGLLFMGPVGVGKTHLSVAILR